VKSESLVDRRGLSQIWPIWTPRLGRSNNRHTIYGKNSRALRTHGLSAALCAYSPYPCRTSFGHTEFQESTLCASTTPAKCWGWAGRGGAPLTPQGFGRECTGGGQWWWCVWLCLCAGGLCGGTWGTTKSCPCHHGRLHSAHPPSWPLPNRAPATNGRLHSALPTGPVAGARGCLVDHPRLPVAIKPSGHVALIAHALITPKRSQEQPRRAKKSQNSLKQPETAWNSPKTAQNRQEEPERAKNTSPGTGQGWCSHRVSTPGIPCDQKMSHMARVDTRIVRPEDRVCAAHANFCRFSL
jgi:hypothetical protein